MALISFSHLLCLCLVISLSTTYAFGFEGRKIAQENHLQLIHAIEISNLLPSADCEHSTKVAQNKASLKVVHKHGPCSQLNQQNGNAPNLVEILLEDQSRVDSIHAKLSDHSGVKETDAAKLPTKSGMSLGTGNYIVSIGLGSPKKDLMLIFDTGSDLTWARCSAAETFDPTKSTSYANVSCSTPLCSSVISATGNPSRCAASTCVYGIQYGDGSYSIGFLGKERLTIGSTDIFNNFYFGCGQDVDGLFGKAAGLLGLGRDKLSVVSQTAPKYNQLFSYCLPSSSSTGFLSFGSSQSKSAKFTPLSSGPSSFYNLDLTGITVGGQKLAIPLSVFSTAGTIIDSGTVVTRLPPAAYSALRSAFRKAMASYPMGKPLSILDTCYDFSKYKTIKVPKIVISFSGGVDVDVDQAGIFVANGLKQVCLAFAGNTGARDTAIFGNTQQRNFEVVYDVSGGKVGFAPASCS
ncbi:aspartyl protease family protein At5g10770 [Ricinus communis]|uniref:Aspartic proteinase nepenthesin-2, putative n=1 Tax=Ricinus communis TaxID=3988 RepID=B9RNR8_RICCO|nr:aspartyl protease family protein At5g10770 [Ricinus communis]EEF46836.1 Aspartic proteinase nepenthesin-2 precursor, putative [Ricinus communis]|eukprot:XP_002515387.1 aspartyl protease family protein At5g10770 [Ricinus communis]